MANSFTALGFIKPEVGADTNLWGGHWNSNADLADAILENFIGTTTTKLFKFDISAIGTTTQRTMTFRDQSITVAGLSDVTAGINTSSWAIITTQTSVGGTFFDIQNISTSFNHLMIVGNMVPGTNSAGVLMRLYNSVGALDTGNNYYWSYMFQPLLQAVNTAAASPNSGVAINAAMGNNASYGCNFNISIKNFQAAKYTMVEFDAHAVLTDNTTPVQIKGFGGRGVNGPITGLNLFVTTGVMTGKCTMLASV